MLRKVDGAEILRRVRDHGVTVMCAAPAVAAAVLEAAQTWEGEIPGRDRVRIIMAGAPPPTKTVARVQEELGWEFIQIYGLTETSPLLTFNRTRAEWDDLDAEERATRLTRAGAPALGVRLAISEDEDNEGEVLARSNVVLEGYWEQPEESERALAGGWFHTGDGGVIGDDGYLTISDRKKDVIITGGENVSRIEVEDVIFSHPAVAEVAVIGIPSEKWGETIMALVVLAEGEQVTEAELIAWCKDKAAGYKAPTVDRVPRRAGPDRDRQAAEVQAARAVLGGPRPAGQLELAPTEHPADPVGHRLRRFDLDQGRLVGRRELRRLLGGERGADVGGVDGTHLGGVDEASAVRRLHDDAVEHRDHLVDQHGLDRAEVSGRRSFAPECPAAARCRRWGGPTRQTCGNPTT